jgi:hypothetical protein
VGTGDGDAPTQLILTDIGQASQQIKLMKMLAGTPGNLRSVGQVRVLYSLKYKCAELFQLAAVDSVKSGAVTIAGTSLYVNPAATDHAEFCLPFLGDIVIGKSTAVKDPKLLVAKLYGCSLWLIPNELVCLAWSVGVTNEADEVNTAMGTAKMQVDIGNNKTMLVNSYFLKPSGDVKVSVPLCRPAEPTDVKHFRKTVKKQQQGLKRSLIAAGIVLETADSEKQEKANVPKHLKHILC